MYSLILSEALHFLLTLGIGLLLFCRYYDWRLIPVCFIFGFLIDIDHWFDYFAFNGFNIHLLKFFDTRTYMMPSGKVYVFLHGWEYVIVFWFASKWLGNKLRIGGLEWAVSLSYLGHLLIDHFSYSHHPLAYCFIYRLLNGFSQESFDGL